MADVHLTCDECNGNRFKDEVLEVKFKGKNISEVLQMTVEEGLDYFNEDTTLCKKIRAKVRALKEVGLEYVQLGQTSNTLSGGEAQRIKLASFLCQSKSKQKKLFIFDEPTTGLHFHDVNKLSHKEISLFARSLEIDIAIDLGGFTHESRTDIFAMSAAPIQLSYIGYLGTMGTDYYDYLIADPVMIPKASQKYYAEKIVYLPSFQVNDSTDLPPEITLTRKEVGLPEDGFVFCCFNNTYKFTPTIFDSWARILGKVNNSFLLLYVENESIAANLSKEAEIRGVNSERLIFGQKLIRNEYLARYRTADLFLDTHPYNAGTTASDALKMGLPIVTMMGQSFNSREAASILTSINLPELITNSLEEYEALAIELATHPEKMQAIKDKLASNLTTAPLYNTKLFVKNLESAYTTMYERHHEGLEPDHIYVE